MIKVQQIKTCSSDLPISLTLRSLTGEFGPYCGDLTTLQAHSSCRHLNNLLSHYPQVAQRKKSCQLRCVFDQAPLPALAVAKLALDQPEALPHFGQNASLDFLQITDQGVYSFVLVQSPALVKYYGNLQIQPVVLMLNIFALVDSPVAGICFNKIFFTVQQSVSQRDDVLNSNCVRSSVNKAELSIYINKGLHPEVPLIDLLSMVHIWVTLTRAVLGGAGRCNQSGVQNRACFKQQAPLDQLGVDGRNLSSQVVGFKQVPESENTALIRKVRSVCVKLSKLTKKDHNVQGLFDGRIRKAKSLLHGMDAKHSSNRKRWMPSFFCRSKGPNKASQIRQSHNKIHTFKKLTLTRSLVNQLKTEEAKVVCFL